MDLAFIDLGIYWVIPIIGLYALGVWLGNQGTIVVYRNYNDIMLIALLIIIPSFASSIFIFFSGNGDPTSSKEAAELVYKPVLTVVAVLVGLAISFIVIRTASDNKNPLKTALALYVKIPTGILFFFHLKNIFTGSSRKSRRHSVFWTIIMVPLLHGLVKDKSKGILASSKRGGHI